MVQKEPLFIAFNFGISKTKWHFQNIKWIAFILWFTEYFLWQRGRTMMDFFRTIESLYMRYFIINLKKRHLIDKFLLALQQYIFFMYYLKVSKPKWVRLRGLQLIILIMLFPFKRTTFRYVFWGFISIVLQ